MRTKYLHIILTSRFKLNICVIAFAIISACNGQKKGYNSSVFNSKKSLKVVSIPVENNRFIGYAYMLPQHWKGKGNVAFSPDFGLRPLVTLQAQNKKTQASLYAANLGYYRYSRSLAQSFEQANAMMAQMGGNHRTPLPVSFRPMPSIEQYTNNEVLPKFTNGFTIVSQKPAPNFFLRKNILNQSKRFTLLTELVNQSNPSQIAVAFTFITRYGNSQARDLILWDPILYLVQGNANNKEEIINTMRLVLNTIDINPDYDRYLASLIRKTTQQNQRNFEILQKTNREVNEHFRQTMRSIQAKSNEVNSQLSQQRSDVMLDVTTYVDSDSGKEYRLPSSNEYYYSNSLDDFLGSDNPLFNPNSNLSSLYNWKKLQKKY